MAITYTRANATWANDEAGGTEIDATALNTIEAGIDAIYKLPNAAGELVYGSAADTLERLAAGTVTQLLHGGTTPSWSQIVSADITDGTIVNGDINASAAIAYSKLNLATSVVNTDISASAAIDFSKLAAVAWTSYTPVLTGAGGNPTMGGGSVSTGRWMKVGRLVVAIANLTFGTSPANPTGLWIVSLPEAAQATNRIVCVGTVYDNSPATNYLFMGRTNTASDVHLFYHGGDRVTGTTPITVAVNDFIALIAVYESAA